MTRRWLVGQILMWGLGAAVLRLAVVPAERCPPVDTAAVNRSIDGALGWLVRNAQPDGRFLYGYNRDTGRISPLYNDTRHAGILYVLYRAGRIRAGDAGMRHVLPNLVQHDGWTAFAAPGDDLDVGASAYIASPVENFPNTPGIGRSVEGRRNSSTLPSARVCETMKRPSRRARAS